MECLWYYNQSGVTELLIMRDPYYGWMCFRSVKTLGASAFSTARNVELYPILHVRVAGSGQK